MVPPRIMSTPHLAELFHQPALTEIAKSDWVRAGKFLRGEWPRQMPRIKKWKTASPIWEDLRHAPYLVIDTEYNPTSQHMWLLGIGGPDTPIYQWWRAEDDSAHRLEVRELLLYLISQVPIVFQNAMADLPILEHNILVKYTDFKWIDDLLFLHSLLWCELSHTLEFIASISGWYEKMKHLPMSDPRYNAGDVAETIAGWEQCQSEAARDPQTLWVYRECLLPLIPIILEAQRLGIRVERQKVIRARDAFLQNRDTAECIAAAYAGYPLNLGSSQQLCQFLTYDIRESGASWLGRLHDTKKPLKPFITMDEDAVAKLRGDILPFDPQQEATVDSTMQRIEEGGHPILEARVLYARATQYLSHYIEPMLTGTDGRVHAHFHPWTQNTGRWSTVNPALAQLPYSLRDALVADEGWVWYEFDWATIELRMIAALAGDKILLEAFEKDWDVHTLNMCDIFGYRYPRSLTKKGIWEDTEWVSEVGFQEEDGRRVFAKTLVYRLCYGGMPEGAPSIPGALTLGLKPSELVASSKRWIAAHPAIKRFWKLIEQQALTKRQLRTFLGRRWNFLSHDRKRILRQMYDFPMQGGVADIMNLTLIRIKKALGDRVRLSYTMHDSIKLQVKDSPTLATDMNTISEIVQAEWNVGGTSIRFPADFKRR